MVKAAQVPDWAYIQMQQLYLGHIQQLEHMDDEPVVVYDEQSQHVIQLNVSAEAVGIQSGMTLAQAWLLSDRLQTQALNPAVERQLLQDIATLLYQTFADVAEDVANNGLWLKLSGLTRLFASRESITQTLADRLSGFDYRLTFAATARCAQLGLDNWQQPLADAAKHFAVASLGLDSGLSGKLQDKLLHMGLTTLDKVLAIPLPVLGKKLGAEVVDFIAELHGHKSLCLPWFHPQVGFTEQVALATETHAWAGLRFVCKRLLQSLERFLRQRQLALSHFQLTLIGRQAQRQPVTVRLAYPQTRMEDFFYLLQVRMESARLHFPVLYVELQADGFEPLEATSGRLEPAASTVSSLPRLLNRLQAKLGGSRVVGLEHAPSWMPEMQQKHCAAGNRAGLAGHRQVQQCWQAPWLITPIATDIHHWTLHGQPQRLQAPWWQTTAQQRDYMLAQDAHGRWGWLYFVEQEQCWYLHGWAS